MILALPAANAAVDFAFSSRSAPFKRSMPETFPLTSRTAFSAILTSLNVARLAASRSVFTLRMDVFVPPNAPRFAGAVLIVISLPAAAFNANGFAAVHLSSVSRMRFIGTATEVEAVLRVPLPFIVSLFAFLGSLRAFMYTSSLSVRV